MAEKVEHRYIARWMAAQKLMKIAARKEIEFFFYEPEKKEMQLWLSETRSTTHGSRN